MLAALIYALCLLYQPPTPPVYQGYVIRYDRNHIQFARTNGTVNSIEGSEALVLVGVSEKDLQTFLVNPRKLLQVVAREASCHGHKILRVSYWKFAPTKEPKK